MRGLWGSNGFWVDGDMEKMRSLVGHMVVDKGSKAYHKRR